MVKKNENFSEWFSEIIEKSEVVDTRYPIKGNYVFLPYGFQIRKHILNIIRELLDEKNHEEVLFPLLISEDQLRKEASHIKGFEDEVFWVTHGGKTPLERKLALRPTSETAIYPMFALWVRSHADLPVKIYQIVSTFRYETKHTRPFIRLREIMTFKEAHTAHATLEEAEKQVEEAIEIYKKFFDRLGIPFIITKRPPWDTFPGAIYSIAFDTIFPDGRTLQIGTIHNLGQTFSKVFNIKFEIPGGKHEYVCQTCYGISDRVIACVIALHGDDLGLCLPPEIAPIQVIIVPIPYKGEETTVNEFSKKVYIQLKRANIRIHLDDRKDITPGRKYFDWEIKGVPIRFEIGPKDVESQQVTLVRRDTGAKFQAPIKELIVTLKKVMEDITNNLRLKSWKKFSTMFHKADTIEEIKKLLQKGGAVKTPWCGKQECGLKIEEATAADILGIEFAKEKDYKDCPICGEKTTYSIVMAKTY